MIFDLLAQRIGGAASHVRTKIMLLKEKIAYIMRMTSSLNEGGTAVHVALRLVVLSFILLVFSKWYKLRNN